MNISEVVCANLRQDFASLLPSSPVGCLSCNVVVGFGSCRKGVLSEDSEIKTIILRSSEEFDFTAAQKIIETFNARGYKKPFFQSILLCVNLIVPYQRTLSGFIHRLYELSIKDGEILLKQQSMRE